MEISKRGSSRASWATWFYHLHEDVAREFLDSQFNMRWTGELNSDVREYIRRHSSIVTTKGTLSVGFALDDEFEWEKVEGRLRNAQLWMAKYPMRSLGLLDLLREKDLKFPRKVAERNYMAVAEAWVYRSAWDQTNTPWFSDESVQVFCREMFFIPMAYTTIDRAIKFWNNTEFFDITRGVRGDRKSCTAIRVRTEDHDADRTTDEDATAWMLAGKFAMESTENDEAERAENKS